MGCDRNDLLHTTKRSRHERHVFVFAKWTGCGGFIPKQSRFFFYIYQNNYRNHTGIYQPSAAAHREDTAKTFLFRGMKKSASGKLRAVRNAKKRPLKVIIFLFARVLPLSIFHSRVFVLACSHASKLRSQASEELLSCSRILAVRIR